MKCNNWCNWTFYFPNIFVDLYTYIKIKNDLLKVIGLFKDIYEISSIVTIPNV